MHVMHSRWAWEQDHDWPARTPVQPWISAGPPRVGCSDVCTVLWRPRNPLWANSATVQAAQELKIIYCNLHWPGTLAEAIYYFVGREMKLIVLGGVKLWNIHKYYQRRKYSETNKPLLTSRILRRLNATSSLYDYFHLGSDIHKPNSNRY